MAGTWTTQNKRRPGAYINTEGTIKTDDNQSIGRTLLVNAEKLNWGANGVIELNQNSNFKALLGAPLNSTNFGALREVLKGALTVLLLNFNNGKNAVLSDDKLPWKITAKYAGTKGNDLKISISKDPADETQVTVSTIFETEIIDQQSFRTTVPEAFKANDYIDVELTSNDVSTPPAETKTKKTVAEPANKLDSLPANSTYELSGGTTEDADITALLNDSLETENYNVVTTAGFAVDNKIHKLVAEIVKRLRENEGYKVRAVLPDDNVTSYDYEGISVVANGVQLDDGTQLPLEIATGYFAGISSAVDESTSLTYAEYPKAVKAFPKFDNEKTIKALDAGKIVFTSKRGNRVVIEQDINSLTTFKDKKNSDFSKNRIVRTLDAIATDTEEVFENTFIGKVNNDETGRDLFKANRVSYLAALSKRGIIEDFNADDISVEQGTEKDSILVNVVVTPIDAIEKLYMTITVD